MASAPNSPASGPYIKMEELPKNSPVEMEAPPKNLTFFYKGASYRKNDEKVPKVTTIANTTLVEDLRPKVMQLARSIISKLESWKKEDFQIQVWIVKGQERTFTAIVKKENQTIALPQTFLSSSKLKQVADTFFSRFQLFDNHLLTLHFEYRAAPKSCFQKFLSNICYWNDLTRNS